MTSADDIVAAVERLPALSVQAVKLLAMSQREDLDVDAVVDVVRYDPSITANLLRLANSVYARGRMPVTTAHDAVVRLGVRRVVSLVVAESFRGTLPPTLPGYDVEASTFLRHSAAVAVLAQHLAHRGNVAEAFTAGLLHDLGKLVTSQFLAQHRPALDAEAGSERLFFSLENELLGTDHAHLAEAVGRRWALPAPVIAAARWHHRPLEAPEADRPIACVVHVANALAHALGFGADRGELKRKLEPAACAALRLDGVGLEAACQASFEELEALAEALTAA